MVLQCDAREEALWTLIVGFLPIFTVDECFTTVRAIIMWKDFCGGTF